MQERMKKEQAGKVKNYRILNACAKRGGILFTGSSLMEQFPVCELAMDAEKAMSADAEKAMRVFAGM